MFMEELDVAESGLHKLIKASYTLLGLSISSHRRQRRMPGMDHQEGTKAPQAAIKIHTDFERGFILMPRSSPSTT